MLSSRLCIDMCVQDGISKIGYKVKQCRQDKNICVVFKDQTSVEGSACCGIFDFFFVLDHC
jgi:hypothetical protein